MKLKRILSLALSGVLAVSMLTACGFGGGVSGSGNKISSETTSVRTAMNTELDALAQGTIDYKTDGDLTNATAAVARTLTEAEAKAANKNGAIVGTSAAAMMGRYVEYDAWTSSFGKYTPTSSEDKTFVTALVFDGSMTAAEVGKAMAANVAKWDLKSIDSKSYTFDGSIAAYKVTIEAADEKAEDTSVWFVGLMLEQDAVTE